MKLRLTCLMLFAILVTAKFGNAQENIWRQIGTEQGLPNATVICFQELKDGRIAMGSPEGLMLFDGLSYVKIAPHSNNSEPINPYVIKLALSENGQLWVATRNSIWLYNLNNNQTQIYQDSNLTTRGALDLEVQGKFLYVLTQNGYLKFEANSDQIKLIEKKITLQNQYSFHVNTNASVDYYINKTGIVRENKDSATWVCKTTNLIDASFDKWNNVWLVLSKNGAYYLNEKSSETKKLPFNLNFKLADHSDHIFSDQSGKIWLSIANALYEFGGLTDSIPIIHKSDKRNPNSIPYTAANCGLTQKNGNTWLGGYAGGIGFTNETDGGIKIIPHHLTNAGFVWCIFSDRDKLLFGCADGLVIGDFKNQTLSNIKTIRPNIGERFTISSIGDFDANNYIIGSYNKQCFLLNKQSYQLKKIGTPAYLGSCQGIISLSKNRLLIQGTGNIAIYDKLKKSWLPKINKPQHINALAACEDNKGNIWIGSGIGLTKLDPNFTFEKQYLHKNGDSLSLPGNVIIYIHESNSGLLYLGSMGNGLIVFDPIKETAKSINLKGNPVNVYGIMELDNSHLIISSSSGIILYNKFNHESKAINKSNKLPYNDFSQLAYYKDSLNYYFGGESSVILIPRKNIHDKFSQNITLAFRQNGLTITSLNLPAENRNFDIQIGPLFAQMMGDVKYEFRLKNKEENWHTLRPNQNEISYNYLPAGNYTIEARLLDENNYYKASPIEINIVIEPYIYETWWFLMSLILIALIIIAFLFKYFGHLKLKRKLKRLEEEQKIAMERIRISRELHDNVGSQLSYLISGLEASEIYLKKNNEEMLTKNLGQLQESARESMQQLRDSIWAYNREAMTIENMSEQFGKWFYKICSPHHQTKASFQFQFTKNHLLDPLFGLNLFRIMQEAVNNALKHAEATQLLVDLKEENSSIIIQITDNGKGFSENNKRGNGMQSMEERAKEIGANLSISSSKANGTSIEVIYKINTTKS